MDTGGIGLGQIGILYTAWQCAWLGLLVYLLSFPTAKAISGLVQVITYIRHPITRAYSNWDTDLPVLGYSLMLNQKVLTQAYNYNNQISLNFSQYNVIESILGHAHFL